MLSLILFTIFSVWKEDYALILRVKIFVIILLYYKLSFENKKLIEYLCFCNQFISRMLINK